MCGKKLMSSSFQYKPPLLKLPPKRRNSSNYIHRRDRDRRNFNFSNILPTDPTVQSLPSVIQANISNLSIDATRIGKGSLVHTALLVNGQAIEFVIDSGADEPLCKDKHAFTGPLRYDHTPIYTASGEVIYSQGIGRIGNFDNIYYVPELQLNLLSVSYLNNLGLSK